MKSTNNISHKIANSYQEINFLHNKKNKNTLNAIEIFIHTYTHTHIYVCACVHSISVIVHSRVVCLDKKLVSKNLNLYKKLCIQKQNEKIQNKKNVNIGIKHRYRVELNKLSAQLHSLNIKLVFFLIFIKLK